MTTTGFDCTANPASGLHVRTFSILDVHPCSFKEPIVETKRFTGQIVQTILYDFREVFQCKVKGRPNIRRCSWFAYLEPVENGLKGNIFDLMFEI